MLIDFSVENFRSIKEIQTLSMSAANIVSKYKELDEQNLHKHSTKLSLLKTKAIYGANASGKSNIIKALDAFISIVVNSVKNEEILGLVSPFRLSTETEFKATFFQLTFVLNKVSFRYGFEATRKEVTSEWLFGTPGKKEINFFTRESNNVKINDNKFKEGNKVIDLYNQDNNNIARKNSLFLTTVSVFNNGISKSIIEFISEIIVVAGLSDFRMHKAAEETLNDDIKRREITDFLKIGDIGITDIGRLEYQKENEVGEKGKTILTITKHKKFDSNLKEIGTADFFMIVDESEGSKKMFEISPLVARALKNNRTLIMDEFDARLHPSLTKKIVELFNSASNKGAQLIFATHDTNLLNAKLLRRDQICFVEKDKYGASHFYSLADFKGVRNDASFEKDYIAGKYGAIPFLGDFSAIIES